MFCLVLPDRQKKLLTVLPITFRGTSSCSSPFSPLFSRVACLPFLLTQSPPASVTASWTVATFLKLELAHRPKTHQQRAEQNHSLWLRIHFPFYLKFHLLSNINSCFGMLGFLGFFFRGGMLFCLLLCICTFDLSFPNSTHYCIWLDCAFPRTYRLLWVLLHPSGRFANFPWGASPLHKWKYIRYSIVCTGSEKQID